MLEGKLAIPIGIPEYLPRTDAAWGYSQAQAASEKFQSIYIKKKKLKSSGTTAQYFGAGRGGALVFGGRYVITQQNLG